LHEQFKQSYLLIGDRPKRYNLMALEGINEEDALQRITRESECFKRFLEKLSSQYESMHVIDWNSAMDDNYIDNLRILKREYDNHKEFRAECDERVKEFLLIPANKRKLQMIGSTIEQGLEIANNYHLEELAMLLSLPISLGKTVCEIYPGTNDVQEKLQRGAYAFCSELKKNPDRLFMEVYHE
ncbi:MAG: tRNA-dependent cyclodipeptide synthase, partial [Nanoarchaeota archaeon]|nr:tRNA-dependent cyclodipeptide synthase [Nanoarchaeota archaeon]